MLLLEETPNSHEKLDQDCRVDSEAGAVFIELRCLESDSPRGPVRCPGAVGIKSHQRSFQCPREDKR